MSDQLTGVFAALADPTRRALYERLLESPAGLSATELANGASVSRQAIVKHLQVLAKSGLAAPSRDGRDVRYVASSEEALHASSWLAERASAWDRRIAQLQAQVRTSSHDERL